MDEVKSRVASNGSAGEKKPSNPPAEEVCEEEIQQPAANEIKSLTIKVPVDGGEPPRFRMHLDISLSGDSAAALRRVAIALDKSMATLKNGRRCVGTNDAIRWMIEQLADKVA